MKALIIIGMTCLFISACGTEQKTAETAPKPAGQVTQAYPIDWCIITGEKLGSMGDPVSKMYGGREVKFCCKHCIEEFEKAPVAYLAKLDSAAAGLIQPPPDQGHGS